MIVKTRLFLICTFSLLLSCSTIGSALSMDTTIPKVLVRIALSNDSLQLPDDAEIISENQGQWIDVILLQSRLSDLERSQIQYTVLISDVDQYSRSVAGSYHSLAEMEQILYDISVTYPNITQLKSIGTTCQGRTIWCLEISDNPGVDEGEPGVFFMGVHHAREWPTLEICLYIAQTLTAQYGSDPLITDLLDTRRVWVTPCMNPDGYYYCHDQGHDWRKNRNFFPEYGTYGVDLNRNYAGSCNGDVWGAWGSVGNEGASHLPSSEVYCGPTAFSENETQAIRSMFVENNIAASITWHNYGEVVLAPWGYGTLPAPDDAYLIEVAEEIADHITKDGGSGYYTAGRAGGITGDMTDWAYGNAYYVQGKATFAYTIESCSAFQPPAEKLDQICRENFNGSLILLKEASNISQVAPQVLPPQIQKMAWDPDGEYTVAWEEQNPAADADLFQLDELSGFSLWSDDAESYTNRWVFDGFSVNISRFHSGEHSYLSRNKSKDVSSMTSLYPIPIREGMNLSFWCWYSIQYNKDYATVEVSTDGRSYEILDTFNGYPQNWTYHTYPLDTYVGDSLFIRFRYTTDTSRTFAGFYVDDISPVADFEKVTTLSDTLHNTSYHISGKTNGTYYYRVKGYNTARGWGDFSTLEKIRVGNTSLTAEIHSPQTHSIYVKNQRIFPFFVTIVLGAIDVKVNVSDPSEIQRVDFYIDNKLQHTAQYLPYNWTWNKRSFFRHTIKIIAYDSVEQGAVNEIIVWKFF